MEPRDIAAGLEDAAQRWADSPVRARTCSALAEHPDVVERLIAPSALGAIPWPWKLSFPLNAAVHALVLAGDAPELERYVPSVGGGDEPDDGFDRALLALVTSREERLRTLTERPLRTQDPRHTDLLQAFLDDARDHFDPSVAWHLLNLGSAAGFELRLGDPARTAGGPVFDQRTGVDLEPIDLGDDDAVQWLLACTDAGVAGLATEVRRARVQLDRLAPSIVRDDAVRVLAPGSPLPCAGPTLLVTHQVLCSVADAGALASAVGAHPEVSRWLSVEVPSVTDGIYPLLSDQPPGTPVATLLDGDLTILEQSALPQPA